MGIQIQIMDEVFGKAKFPVFEIENPSETLTVRELITRRVETEVSNINAARQSKNITRPEHRMFMAGLTKLSPEVLMNRSSGTKRRKPPIDAESATQQALKAFNAGHYYILFNDKQVETLDEPLFLTPESEATFLRLTPLMGG